MTTDHKLGKTGEKLACDFLLKKNFSILKQNWRSGRYGEIDVIAVDNSTKELVFIEVKSRATSINDAKELVSKKKQQKLYMLANSYLYLHAKENTACRFDVIAVRINHKGQALEHIRNAFYLQ
ncbi:MAG: YraN family protein [Candidatus Melainabacteria bacterium RIFCSPHIGHO2_02_FULL_34_12]|nr:MAG: YraN family protein [Candidatus Melainabacteria bacterium RIFCSPHIGHO2_02_FULL_34_12]